jgi:hypothetical protein
MISVSFWYVSAAVLRLPDTDRAERRHQTACLFPLLRVASRCFTFSFHKLIRNQECFSGSFVSAAFLRRPGTGRLSRRNRTLSQHRDKRCDYGIVKEECIVFVRFCGCALRARHGLSVWATPDRVPNIAL